MRYVIEHTTRLAFPTPVREHLCELRIAPRTNGQKLLELEIKAEPGAELASFVDAFGNTVHWFGVVEPHDSLATRVETSLANPFGHETIDPARYAVGYVDPLAADDGKEAAAEATLAWAEVLIPGAGWRGFDVTNGLVVNDTCVTVAVGRDSADAAPQRGSFKGEDPGTAPEVCVRVSRED